MNYYTVTTKTTVGTMKRSCVDDDQRVFPMVNDKNIFQGLIYAEDLKNCDDSNTADEVLIQAKKWDERDVYVLSTQPSTEAKDILRRWKLQFVPVVDQDHRIVGTIDEDS